jgi:hypothetical protein
MHVHVTERNYDLLVFAPLWSMSPLYCFKLRPQTPKHIRPAAGHIILTPVNQLMVLSSQYGHCPQGHVIRAQANQLMVMVIGFKLWSLSNPGFEPATFRSLAQGANQLR